MSNFDISKTRSTLQFASGSSPVATLTCPAIPETDLLLAHGLAHRLFAVAASALVACLIQVQYAG
jgi:hypothetical protein